VLDIAEVLLSRQTPGSPEMRTSTMIDV